MRKDIKYRLKSLMLALVMILGLFAVSSCEDMDDTYDEYIIERVYSPKVKNLTAETGYRTVTLRWDNPEGNLAQKIEIRYEDQKVVFEEMVQSAVVNNLEAKGYDISVYTIDLEGNYSVPVTVYVFPGNRD